MSHSPDLAAVPFPRATLPEDTTPKAYPQFVLFGDSITQGCSHVLYSSLADWYQRRLDVINRGFSGYTAPAGYDNLLRFFPLVPPTPITPRVQLMTVFFGANDACLPGQPQHVPLDTYKDSLRKIAGYEGVHMHGTQVIPIVPPPVDEWQFGDNPPQRTAVHTAKYAAACRDVGHELGLPVLDLWTIFMLKAGWKPDSADVPLIGSKDAPRNEVLAALLSDGLHFTPAGYRLVFDELVQLIRSQLPDHLPENLPSVFPDWKAKLGLL